MGEALWGSLSLLAPPLPPPPPLARGSGGWDSASSKGSGVVSRHRSSLWLLEALLDSVLLLEWLLAYGPSPCTWREGEGERVSHGKEGEGSPPPQAREEPSHLAHLAVPVGGILAHPLLPAGPLAHAIPVRGTHPGLRWHVPERLSCKDGEGLRSH